MKSTWNQLENFKRSLLLPGWGCASSFLGDNMKRIAIITVAALLLVVGGLVFPRQDSKADSFDHFQCQYPTRVTNPPNGCDNSEPPCPEEIKGGTCSVPQPVATQPSPTASPQPSVTPPTEKPRGCYQ